MKIYACDRNGHNREGCACEPEGLTADEVILAFYPAYMNARIASKTTLSLGDTLVEVRGNENHPMHDAVDGDFTDFYAVSA